MNYAEICRLPHSCKIMVGTGVVRAYESADLGFSKNPKDFGYDAGWVADTLRKTTSENGARIQTFGATQHSLLSGSSKLFIVVSYDTYR